MKRIFDFVIAIVLLVLLLPLLAVIAFLVRMRIGSPVMFRQIRPGKHGVPFYLLKFRTMTEKTDSSGQPLPDHDRLVPFGQFLRKYSLDELPQIWNVAKGDISLVGPRPLLMEYLPLYTEEQAKRHCVKPGITGWAQVNGRNAISWEEKFKYDVWYVENQSFWLDLKILWMTFFHVLKPGNIQHGNHVTMPVFKGTVNYEQER